jgi:hypothetical protein
MEPAMNTQAFAITAQPKATGWWRALLRSARGQPQTDALEDESTWLGYEAAHPLTWVPGGSLPAQAVQSE